MNCHVSGSFECSFFNEGMNILLTFEYMDNFSLLRTAYYDYVLITKCLCEIVGSDKMLDAYSTCQMDIVKTELLKLNSDASCYEELVMVINDYHQALMNENVDHVASSKPKFIQALLPI